MLRDKLSEQSQVVQALQRRSKSTLHPFSADLMEILGKFERLVRQEEAKDHSGRHSVLGNDASWKKECESIQLRY